MCIVNVMICLGLNSLHRDIIMHIGIIACAIGLFNVMCVAVGLDTMLSNHDPVFDALRTIKSAREFSEPQECRNPLLSKLYC